MNERSGEHTESLARLTKSVEAVLDSVGSVELTLLALVSTLTPEQNKEFRSILESIRTQVEGDSITHGMDGMISKLMRYHALADQAASSSKEEG